MTICVCRLPTIEEGEEYFEFGTSASTPVAAAVIALLNDFLISQGKPPLGFANPWLYTIGLQGTLLIDYTRPFSWSYEGPQNVLFK